LGWMGRDGIGLAETRWDCVQQCEMGLRSHMRDGIAFINVIFFSIISSFFRWFSLFFLFFSFEGFFVLFFWLFVFF